MMRAAVVLSAVVAAFVLPAAAQTSRQIRVDVQFRQTGTAQRDAAGAARRDVGTALRVRASLLPDDRIRVRLTPTISYVSADGSGTIDFTEATTDVIVPNGRAVILAGSTTSTHVVTRQILGIARDQSTTETTVTLTATAR